MSKLLGMIPRNIPAYKGKDQAEAAGAILVMLGEAIEAGEIKLDEMWYSAPGTSKNKNFVDQWQVNLKGRGRPVEAVTEEPFSGQLF